MRKLFRRKYHALGSKKGQKVRMSKATDSSVKRRSRDLNTLVLCILVTMMAYFWDPWKRIFLRIREWWKGLSSLLWVDHPPIPTVWTRVGLLEKSCRILFVLKSILGSPSNENMSKRLLFRGAKRMYLEWIPHEFESETVLPLFWIYLNVNIHQTASLVGFSGLHHIEPNN
jgi:hypothetical protein